MANICCDDVIFYTEGNPEGLYDLWEDLETYIILNQNPDLCWIGNLFSHKKIDSTGISLRGNVSYMEWNDTYILLSLETAWTPLYEAYQAIAAAYHMKIIQERIGSLKEMLEELFTFTKLKNDSFHLEMSSCCINKILKDTIFSYYDEWTGRGIEPEIQITDKLLFMNGNEQGIQRIFQNIIKNGLDHGEKKISISLEEVENNIRIQIKNQVCHVEKINVDQVFERFYKADEARSKTSSGLGLSIAKELVYIRIKGNPGMKECQIRFGFLM